MTTTQVASGRHRLDDGSSGHADGCWVLVDLGVFEEGDRASRQGSKNQGHHDDVSDAVSGDVEGDGAVGESEANSRHATVGLDLDPVQTRSDTSRDRVDLLAATELARL